MNLLAVGAERYETILTTLEDLREPYILVDDGSLIRKLRFPKRRKVTHFNFQTDSIDVLKGIDYPKAANLTDVIEAAFPAGANTLTKQDSAVVLLEALLSKPRALDTLLPSPKKTDPIGHTAAYRKIQRILLSPILRPILTSPTNFSLRGIVLVRLPLTIPRFDRFIIGNLLASLYPGQVAFSNFAFYGCELHKALIDQNRLIAGINFLDETPLKNDLLLIPNKVGHHTTAPDAETLADYCSEFARGTIGYKEDVRDYMK